jgi:type II secretory pathway predicted ATPase ExeA
MLHGRNGCAHAQQPGAQQAFVRAVGRSKRSVARRCDFAQFLKYHWFRGIETMYADYFGLRALPFENRADARFTLLTSEQEDALTAIEYQWQNGGTVTMLLGGTGIGKTQFIRTFSTRIQGPDQIAILPCPASGQRDLLREVCKSFGVQVTCARGGRNRRIERLQRHLERVKTLGNRCALIVDQAENLSAANLDHIAALVDLHHNSKRLLSVILAGKPTLRTNIQKLGCTSLLHRVTGEHVLQPLDQEQSAAYIRHRLAIVGCHDERLFDGAAIEWIHRRSGGVPRAINVLCHHAMLSACEAGETGITRDALLRLGSHGIEMLHTAMVQTVGARGSNLGAPAISATNKVVKAPVGTIDANDAHAPRDGSDFDPEIGAPAHWCNESASVGVKQYDYSAIHPDSDTTTPVLPLNSMEEMVERVEHLCRKLNAEGVAVVQAELDHRWQLWTESIEPTLRLVQSLYECKVPDAEATVAQSEQRIEYLNKQIAQTVSQIEKLEGTCRERMVAVCQSVVEEQRAALQRSIHELVEAARQEVKLSCASASDYVREAETRLGQVRLNLRESMKDGTLIERESPNRLPVHGSVPEPQYMASGTYLNHDEAPASGTLELQTRSAGHAVNDLLRKLDSHHAAAASVLKTLTTATVKGRQLIEEARAVDAALRHRQEACAEVLADTDGNFIRARAQAIARLNAQKRTTEPARLGQPAHSGDLKRFGHKSEPKTTQPIIEQTQQADATANPSSPRARG